MNLSPDQEENRDRISDYFQSPAEKFSYNLGGGAGTGKTTLLKSVTPGLPLETTIFCAPTAKAGLRMKANLPVGAEVMTFHKAFYAPIKNPIEEEYEELERTPEHTEEQKLRMKELDQSLRGKRRSPKFGFYPDKQYFWEEHGVGRSMPFFERFQRIAVDESSMLNSEMAADCQTAFRKYGTKFLAIGDHFQLPPPKGDEWFKASSLDGELTTIHRQAVESAIIKSSLGLRGGDLKAIVQAEGEIDVFKKGKTPEERYFEADQIITGKNSTRWKINRFMRNKMGITDWMPVIGDKVICTMNDRTGLYDELVNGAIARIVGVENNRLSVCMEDSGTVYKNLMFFDQNFKRNYLPADELPYVSFQRQAALAHFDFGYAITVHKSQGSEWDHVMVADDGFLSWKKTERLRWLYTAVTRAKSKLTYIG